MAESQRMTIDEVVEKRSATSTRTSCANRLGHCRRSEHGMWRRYPADLQPALAGGGTRPALGGGGALEGRLDKVAEMLEEAEEDILAFYAFPAAHRRKLRSSNPLERLHREIGSRTDVVGIFPDDAPLIRLASMLAIELKLRGR